MSKDGGKISDGQSYSFCWQTSASTIPSSGQAFWSCLCKQHCRLRLSGLLAVPVQNVKLTLFKVDDSVALGTFTMLFNHHLYLVPEHFHYPERKPCTH